MVKRKWGMTANVLRVAFEDSENVLKLTMVTGAQLRKYIKTTEFAP